MRLSRLILKDFGLYRGKQVFELSPRTKYGRNRPIILIGGHNGAGKTTVLESIRLCLYGRLALGDRVKEQDYYRYLAERVHRNRSVLIPSNTAYVEIDFEYARAGKRQNYTVRRSWEITGSKVAEDLSVLCDGLPLENVESQFWSDFLRSLVPPGLSELFFFDGEKIQRLAEDTSDSAALSEAVKALLGLDLVERLKADLDLYASREARKTSTASVITRLTEIDVKLEAANRSLEDARATEAEPRTKLEVVQKDILRLESALAAEGGGLLSHRAELTQRKQWLERRIDEVQRSLREMLEGDLPIAACPKLAVTLQIQLESEAMREEWGMAQDRVSSLLKTIDSRLLATAARKRFGLSAETSHAIRDELKAIAAESAQLPAELKEVEIIHGLARREREDTLAILREAISDHAALAVRLSADLINLEGELSALQEKMNRIPSDDELAPRIKELNQLHRTEAELRTLLTQREAARHQLELQVAEFERQHERFEEQLKREAESTTRLATARKIRGALDAYLERLTATKVSQLETATMTCFEQLCRKGDLVRRIHIDPKSFRIDLSDSTGRTIPKSELSAGEKQIYAISVLWALAKVSGRPLPMIIDTPLGRLDSIHRQRLIERYFPVAAHQVIILSTDTEVDAECYREMRSHVSHSIKLVHHSDGWTEVQPGYFWEDPNVAASA